MNMDLTIDVEVEGTIIKGRPEHFNSQFGNRFLTDPHEVNGLRVWIVKGEYRIEISKFLSDDDIEGITRNYIELEIGAEL